MSPEAAEVLVEALEYLKRMPGRRCRTFWATFSFGGATEDKPHFSLLGMVVALHGVDYSQIAIQNFNYVTRENLHKIGFTGREIADLMRFNDDAQSMEELEEAVLYYIEEVT